jgi:hypothetical protein
MSKAIFAMMIKQKFASLFLLAVMSFLERESRFAFIQTEYFTQAVNFKTHFKTYERRIRVSVCSINYIWFSEKI